MTMMMMNSSSGTSASNNYLGGMRSSAADQIGGLWQFPRFPPLEVEPNPLLPTADDLSGELMYEMDASAPVDSTPMLQAEYATSPQYHEGESEDPRMMISPPMLGRTYEPRTPDEPRLGRMMMMGQDGNHQDGMTRLPFNPEYPNPSPLARQFEDCLNCQPYFDKQNIVFSSRPPRFHLRCGQGRGRDYEFQCQAPFQFSADELSHLRKYPPTQAEQINFYLPPTPVGSAENGGMRPLMATAKLQSSNGRTIWSTAPYLIKLLSPRPVQ